MKKLMSLFLMVTTLAVSSLSITASAQVLDSKAPITQTVLVSDQELADTTGGKGECWLAGIGFGAAVLGGAWMVAGAAVLYAEANGCLHS